MTDRLHRLDARVDRCQGRNEFLEHLFRSELIRCGPPLRDLIAGSVVHRLRADPVQEMFASRFGRRRCPGSSALQVVHAGGGQESGVKNQMQRRKVHGEVGLLELIAVHRSFVLLQQDVARDFVYSALPNRQLIEGVDYILIRRLSHGMIRIGQHVGVSLGSSVDTHL